MENIETRYCIEYINPQYPLRDDGSLNIRYDRVLTLEQAEHDLTLILSFGGKILDLYMGNVVDGETGEWSPKPMIIDDDDWFSTKWLNALEVKEVKEPTASDRGMAGEIIINLKRVEQDYCIDLTKEMEWLRNIVKKGE